jgi:hypothetical protein
MFRKELWVAGLIGGGAGLLIFEMCDLWLGPGFISSIVGVAIFAVVLVILVLIVNRRLAKRAAAKATGSSSA